MSKKRKSHSTISAQQRPESVLPTPVTPAATARAPERNNDKSAPASPTERIGDTLRAKREKRGDDIYHIAEYLCIKPDFLLALENSQYELFPADAYVIGFLRSYAVYLGMDGKEAIDRYRSEMAGRRRKPSLAMPVPVAEGRAPSMVIMAGAAFGILLIYAVWYGLSSSDRSTVSHAPALPTTAVIETPAATTTNTTPIVIPVQTSGQTSSQTQTTPVVVPSQPAASSITLPAPAPAPQALTANTAKAPAPVVAAAAAVAPTEAPTPDISSGASSVSIYAAQPSWIMVADGNGKTVFDRVLKTGEIYKVPNGKGYTLTTGNISGISLSVDGISMPRPSAPHDGSRVVRGISLDPAKLRTGATDINE